MSKGRFLELEGVRGLAAISVVIFHAIIIFYPAAAYGDGSATHSWFEGLLHGNPINVLFSGLFAVTIFFVLSGFVLSIGFLNGDDSIIKKLASRRYLRLMIPALCSIVAAYFLLEFGTSYFRDEAVKIIGGGSLAIQWNFDPNIFEALKQGLWSIFATGEDTYNRVLWTMHYEFFGSFLVFLLLFVFGRAKYRLLLFTIVFLLSFGSWYMGFMLGLILADLYVSKKIWLRKLEDWRIGITVLLIGLIIGGYPLAGVSETMYGKLTIPWLTDLQNIIIYLSIGAFLVIASIVSNGALKKLFSKPKLAIIGKYTFSLYLTHMLVLLTLTPMLFVGLYPVMGYGKAVAASIVISTPFIGIVTWFFEKYIDSPAIALSARFSSFIETGSLSARVVREKVRAKTLWKKLTEIPG